MSAAPPRRVVVCLGGANVDRKLRVFAPVLAGSSNPATASESFGGVVRNVAENLARCGVPVQLLTAVGADGAGRALLDDAVQCGIDTQASEVMTGALTGSYTAVLNPDGSLYLALAHMDLCDRLTPAWLAGRAALCREAALVIADLNLPADTLAALVEAAAGGPEAPPLVLVAVSEAKMGRLSGSLRGVRLLVLNQGELAAWSGTPELTEGLTRLLAAGVQTVVVTLGEAGLCLADQGREPVVIAATPVPPKAVVDVTGAGDALAAALCRALYAGEIATQGWPSACEQALARAALTVQSPFTVVREDPNKFDSR